jgi:hypothetical protein
VVDSSYLPYLRFCVSLRTMTAEQIEREAASLPAIDRGRIASALLRSLPQGAYDVSDEEVAQRFHEMETGQVEDISFAELKASLNFQTGE